MSCISRKARLASTCSPSGSVGLDDRETQYGNQDIWSMNLITKRVSTDPDGMDLIDRRSINRKKIPAEKVKYSKSKRGFSLQGCYRIQDWGLDYDNQYCSGEETQYTFHHYFLYHGIRVVNKNFLNILRYKPDQSENVAFPIICNN